jgi:uncharacterized protein
VNERASGRAGREYRFRPAWWLPGAHAQTIWGRFARRRPALPLKRVILPAPDGDNIEVHVLPAPDHAPRVLLLHGLEGSVRSHYVGGMFQQAQRRGWGAVLLVHRGCGSEPNAARRFYHSGETSDLAQVFAHFADRHPRTAWMLGGVSLGGNVLLKWLGEIGSAARPRVVAAAAISVPFDLEAGARHIATGFARVYDRSFLRSLRRKAMAKLARYPDLFDRARLKAARCVFDFDDVVTAPIHGFRDAVDYYSRSSSLGFLGRIAVPTLLLSARDDPFLPPEVLTRVEDVIGQNPFVELEVTPHGGHVGFVSGRWPWNARFYAEERVFRHFDGIVERLDRRDYD